MKDEKVPKRLRTDDQGGLKDVFALVKGYMSDTFLSQPPLLVYPQNFLRSTERYFNEVLRTNCIVQQSLEVERQAELQKLADGFEKHFPHMKRAVSYYRSLLDNNRLKKGYGRLEFLEAGPPNRSHVGDVKLGEELVDARSHYLQVVYHQRPEVN